MSSENVIRQTEILRLLQERTNASIDELAGQFQVSGMTVRRDLQKLVDSGDVIRIPGGARVARSMGFEKTFAERMRKMAAEKEKIGRAAASLVRDGEAVVIDSGTTTLWIARYLRGRRGLVVITFSLAVLEELAGSEEVRVELTGGVYRRSSHDLIGQVTHDSLDSVSAHKVFFGAAALSFRKGAMVFDPDAARNLVRSGRERILVIDSSKVGHEALYGYCPLEQCDLVITDSGIKPADRSRLEKMTKVMVAE